MHLLLLLLLFSCIFWWIVVVVFVFYESWGWVVIVLLVWIKWSMFVFSYFNHVVVWVKEWCQETVIFRWNQGYFNIDDYYLDINTENFMFTISMVQLFIFTTTESTFSKIYFLLSGKRSLYLCYIYIINHYFNKK